MMEDLKEGKVIMNLETDKNCYIVENKCFWMSL
jgi:hypothetical protein